MTPLLPATLSTLGFLAACLLLGSGCAATFPPPYSAADAVLTGTGAALASYLARPGATLELCDGANPGPRMRTLRPDDFADFTDGLAAGQVDPEIWRRCAEKLLQTQPAPASASLLDAMGRAYRKLLRDPEIERDPRRVARLDALHGIYLRRPLGDDPHADLMKDLGGDLQQALARRRLGPVAARYGEDLLASLDLDRGLWQGRPIDAATLDAIQAKGDEALLRRFAARLRDAGLRREAWRRIVRIHLAASPWPEVREHAAEVEQRVLATGRNAVDLGRSAPVRGLLDARALPVQSVLARQNVRTQRVAFQGRAGDGRPVSGMDLRLVLRIELDGLSKPAPLCAPPGALDVSPCVLPSDLRLGGPVASLDEAGTLHFADGVASLDALALVRDQLDLAIPVELAGKRLFDLVWPLRFEKPADLFLDGPTGGRGPNLRVRVEQRDARRLFLTVEGAGRSLVAAVELADAPAFVLASRGGQGETGASGSSGLDGSAGSDGGPASCPSLGGGNGGNGGDGSDGGDGGPGGPAGNGGDVEVRFTCSAGDCAALPALLARMIQSRAGLGGPGGWGGSGGRGGRGGNGGSGTTCSDGDGSTHCVSGGSSGADGHDGNSGSRGADGPPGRPGRAVIVP